MSVCHRPTPVFASLGPPSPYQAQLPCTAPRVAEAKKPSGPIAARPQRFPKYYIVRSSAIDIRPAQATTMTFRPAKPTLFDVPVSNNGARIRFLIYKKRLDIDIKAPSELGGLRSAEYLALNPYGKMPLLVLPDGTSLPESQVIESYLLDKYANQGPSLLPNSPEERAIAALAARVHDLYVAPIQGCMYKDMTSAEERASQLIEISFHLNVLERVLKGPFVCGDKISYGDAALFPTFVFMTYILPRHFGWKSVFTNRPKLEAWWSALQADPEAAKVIQELQGGLDAWEAGNRWQVRGITEQVTDATLDWTCGN